MVADYVVWIYLSCLSLLRYIIGVHVSTTTPRTVLDGLNFLSLRRKQIKPVDSATSGSPEPQSIGNSWGGVLDRKIADY